MANTTSTAQLDIKVTGLEQLDRVSSNFTKLEAKLGALKTAIAAVGFSAFIKSSVEMSQALADISDSTGMSVNSLLELQDALSKAGGQVNKMPEMIVKFSQSIDAATKGSIDLQYAFSKVGVSLADLQSMSEQDLLKKTIDGLARMQAGSERTTIQTDLLGKSARSMIPDELSRNLAAARGQFDNFGESIKRAAALGDTMENSMNRLRVAVIDALGPLIEKAATAVTSLTATKEAMDQLVNVLKVIAGLAITALSFTFVGRAVRILGGILRSLNAIRTAFTSVASGAAAIGTAISRFFSISPQGPLMTTLRYLGGLLLSILGVTTLLGGSEEERGNKSAQASKMAAEAAKREEEIQRKVLDGIQKRRVEIEKIVTAFRDQNSQQIDNINTEAMGIGKSKEYNEILKAQVDMSYKAAAAVKQLQEQKAGLTIQEREQGLGRVIDENIAKIEERARADSAAMEDAIKYRDRLLAKEELHQFAMQQQIDANKQIRQIQDETAKLTLNEIQKKYLDIGAAAREAAESAIQAEAKRRGVDQLTQAEQEKYYEAARANVKKLQDETKKHYDQSRTWSTGWKQAFNDYVDNATNASKQAQDMFQKFTSGMEDLIVNFTKTGKFQWKNFLAMMVEELLRAQIRQTFASLMTSMSGMFGSGSSSGGGLLGMIGSLFGGSGGTGQQGTRTNPTYVYDLSSGGAGGMGNILGGGTAGSGGTSLLGGIWNGIKNVGSSIGNAIGNIGSSIGNIGSSIGNAVGNIFSSSGSSGGGLGSVIDSIGSSVSDLFSGWFANGGVIPAGKFGVVGERGPELIGGPATISPMAGGNVTYNINAVDAASFKAMIARDPAFIHAVAQQGAATMPGTRR